MTARPIIQTATAPLRLTFAVAFFTAREFVETAIDISAEVDADRAAVAAGGENHRCAAENAETEFLAGDRQLFSATARELQEHAVIGAAFVQLSRRGRKRGP